MQTRLTYLPHRSQCAIACTLSLGAMLFAVLLPQHALAQRLRIIVGGPDFRPFPIAVPFLSSSDEVSVTQQKVDQLTMALRQTADLSRSLEVVPPATYLSSLKDTWNKPLFSNWANVGASGLIRGHVEIVGEEVKATLRFYDVVAQREILAKTYTEPLVGVTRIAYQFTDEIIFLLTGEHGVFSSRIAYVKRNGKHKVVYTANVDGIEPRRVSPADALSLLPAWDSKGQYILFTSFINGNSDLFRVTLATGALETLSAQRGLNTGAAVSPDGKQVALTLSKDGNTEIYIMDANGENLRRLTDSFGQDVSPTFSPDGKRIAFVSSRGGTPQIYVMDTTGANVRRLTFAGNYNQEPHWSPRPDGQIVFTARDERLKFDIFLVHPETSEITRLTQDEGNNESASFSPDGHQLVFVSTRPPGATRKLYIMDADGHHQRRISNDNADYETPTWGPRLGYK